MTTSFDLSGRTALVTGSSRGIGRALADALLGAGATVAVHGRDEARARQTAAELAERHGAARVRPYVFDVTVEEDAERGVAAVERDFGAIDILVNNAGIQHREPLVDVPLEQWESVLRTNVTAAFLVGRLAVRGMIERGHGKIINICSVQTELARPTIGPYTAAKGAVRNLTRAMTAEWAGFGIQINGLAPGYIHTEMTQALVDDEKFNAWVLGRTPAGRWGEPADLGGTAVFLASAASNFVTGQVIYVDGGMTAVV